jgi:flavin-dependent dehydrogenase
MKSGAEIKRGTTVASLEHAHDGWKVHVAGDDSAETFFARAVFLSTGKHDLRGWQRPPSIHNDLVGLKMHFCPPEREGDHSQHDQQNDWRDVVIALFDGGYAGLEMIEEGRINLCLVISKRRFRLLNHSWEMLFDELVSRTPMLAERLQGAKPCWEKPLAIYGIPYGFVHREKSHMPGLYRLGDQMAVIPSFFGNGMSIALRSAFLAAENYLHANESRYHRQLAGELSPKLYPAAILSRMMVAPLMQPWLFWACRTFPPLVEAAAASTRLEIAR